MGDLLVLIFTVIASVGVAALILGFSEFIIVTLPVVLTQTVKGNGAQLASARQRLTDQNKARSCPSCQSETYSTESKVSPGKDSRSSSGNSLYRSR